MPSALRAGAPPSRERYGQLQQILNRAYGCDLGYRKPKTMAYGLRMSFKSRGFEVSIADANDLAVLEDYEIAPGLG